jgi:hypothetical protein
MAAELGVEDHTHLEELLKRKTQNIPKHMIPGLSVNRILQTPQALRMPIIPLDLQLPFLLRNRAEIERYALRPIKDAGKQALDITRAIFFYQLDEVHQFQRYHDKSRWNFGILTALLSISDPSNTSPEHAQANGAQKISPAGRRFMSSYLAAALERQNTPMVFDKREDFIRRWKDSRWDLFARFATAQKKLLKKEMVRLKRMWEDELDKAIKEMGRDQYNSTVAPFVGCIVPGRKDQGLSDRRSEKEDVTSSSLKRSEIQQEQTKELLDALREPLSDDRHQDYQDEDAMTPVDVRHAIDAMQRVRPTQILPVLLRHFPGKELSKQTGAAGQG